MRTFAATILACGVLAIRLREAGTAGTVGTEAMPDPNAPLAPPVQTDDPDYVMPPTGTEEDIGSEPLPIETPLGECTGAATDPADCGPLEPGAQGAEIPMPPADGPAAGGPAAGGPPAGGPPAGGPPAGGPPAGGPPADGPAAGGPPAGGPPAGGPPATGPQDPIPPVTGDAPVEDEAV